MDKRKIISMVEFISLFFVFVPLLYAQPSWPPQIGQSYPDTEFIDQTGKKVKLADFKGKIILVEYVGMNCPACQAFSGANTAIGPFENNPVQSDLKSTEEIFPIYTQGVSLSDERIVFIQVLLYDMKMGYPQPDDAKRWAQHFQKDRSKNFYVVVPAQDLRGNASYNLIPGYQLVDKNLILRSDSTGHSPRENLYTQLLPLVPKLLKE